MPVAMPVKRPEGLVFISYAHDDRARVEPLVDQLARRFNVWWDRNIELGDIWRRTLMDKLHAARCVVVVWSELDRVKDRGVVVPVKLDRSADIPPPFDQMQHLDLTGWSGRPATALQPLFDRVRRLLNRPHRTSPYTPTLSESGPLDESLRAASELQDLSEQIRTIGGILIPGAGPVEDLLGTIEEVHRTYSAVNDAIGRFLAPAARKGKIDLKPYLAMERGELATLIRNNRGHCTRIVEYYVRAGGLRDWLQPRLTPQNLQVLDDAFGQLGNADGDLFEGLSRIGDAMTGEASAIAGLLLGGQERMARQRILESRQKLIPLERKLTESMAALQRIESSLGFVPRDRKRAGGRSRKRRTR
jgi:hypothetical protein